MGSRALGRRMYTLSIFVRGKVYRFRKVQWPEAERVFIWWLLFSECSRFACWESREYVEKRWERVVLRNTGRLWGNVVLPEERIKDSEARELRILKREWFICWSLGSNLDKEENDRRLVSKNMSQEIVRWKNIEVRFLEGFEGVVRNWLLW